MWDVFDPGMKFCMEYIARATSESCLEQVGSHLTETR